MRNTKKNRENEKKLLAAIKAECEKVYGKKIGEKAANYSGDYKNMATCSHNSFDCMTDCIRTYIDCYYVGKKPNTGLRYDSYTKITQKQMDALKTIKYDDLQSVKAYYDWKKGVEALEEKKKKTKQDEKEMKLDFDGEISIKEIANKYANYYVDWKRTKISFHERCGANSHKRVPEMSINIKPSRIERFANGGFTYVYNEKEFNEKMANAKHTPKISDEQIAFARKNGIIAFCKKTCVILAYDWKGTGRYWTSSARHYDFNILTKKDAFKKEVLLLKKIRDTKKYI